MESSYKITLIMLFDAPKPFCIFQKHMAESAVIVTTVTTTTVVGRRVASRIITTWSANR